MLVTNLRTDNELEDGNLLGQTLFSEEVGGEVSSSGLTLVASDGSGGSRAGDSSDGSNDEESSVLHV